MIVARSDQDQAQDICTSYGASFDHVFTGADGFHARMTDTQAQAMISDPRVAIIESDDVMVLAGSQQLSDTTDEYGPAYADWQWGLDAIDQTSGARDYLFNYTNTGYSVSGGYSSNVFIVGTGIWSGHPDLGGRTTLDCNLYDAPNPAIDTDGHDTKVATVVGGDTCGVAKLAKIHAVKVGSGSTLVYDQAHLSKVIDGMSWVLNNYNSYVGPSVINCSYILGTSKQVSVVYSGPTYPKNKNDSVATCMDKIVNSLIKAGAPVVVPAGNSAQSVSNFAPTDVDSAIIVAGANPDFTKWANSNYGSKVDLFAPAYNVRAGSFDIVNGQYQMNYGHWNGTSYAAPFVTGAVAAYLETHPKAKVSDVSSWLKTSAKSRMQGGLQGSPNKFLYLKPGGY